MLSTKTQYAGSTIHKIIIHLLKYLSQKYFQDFELTDEGKYWETEDETILEKNFKAYNDLVEGFVDSVNNYPINNTESFTDYFERIIKMLAEKRNKK
jgi:5'-deoxynucleotidase YfbR-like HD superfamily hydrolase